MKDVAIFGAGGFGREVACLIRKINEQEPEWNLIGFFDDSVKKGTIISHFGMVIGGIEELNVWDREISVTIAIGNPKSIKYVKDRITNSKVNYPNLINPDFIVADRETFSIGKGNIIQGGCAATCNVKIGDFNILNGDISLGHDDRIGSYNVLMPALRVSGEVTIGDSNLIGVGSIILQQIKIGNGVHLGAGAVLMTKPKDECTYIGNPARLFKY